MEKLHDTNNLPAKNEIPKSVYAIDCESNNSNHHIENKIKWKSSAKASKLRKKLASQPWSADQSGHLSKKKLDNIRRHVLGSKLKVLKKNEGEAVRQNAVNKKPKIICSNVPDRLQKYKRSYQVRPEAKLLLHDYKLKNKTLSIQCSENSCIFRASKEHLLGNHLCAELNDNKTSDVSTMYPSKNEADSLKNNYKSDLESKNSFDKLFNECLDSTRDLELCSPNNFCVGNFNEYEGFSNSLQKKSQPTAKQKNFNKVNKTEIKLKTSQSNKHDALDPTSQKMKSHTAHYNSHKNMRHVCSFCHKVFKSNGKLNNHVFSHTGERPFNCTHCGKAFSSRFKLVRHVLIHSEIRKFVCEICDRTFLRNDHLKNHYKVHDPKKKTFKCLKENCNKEYASLLSYKKHMAYHNAEDGDLKCLICNIKFEGKEELLSHLKSHSGSRILKSQNDKKFKCEICSRHFLTRKDVTRHLVVHTGERDFLCQFCPQRFGRKDHLVRHIKKSHTNHEIPVKTEVESKNCSRTSQICDVVCNSKTANEPFDSSRLTGSIKSTSGCDLVHNNTQTKKFDNKIEADEGGFKKNPKHSEGQEETEGGVKITSFQTKNELLVPKKEEMMLPSKGKSSMSQVLLQNVPNVLIIPNNSIILLRNQYGGLKNVNHENIDENVSGGTKSVSPTAIDNIQSCKESQAFVPGVPGDAVTSKNSDFEGTLFPPSSQFLGGLVDGCNFYDFSPELPQFSSNFSEVSQPNLENIAENDLFSRVELSSIPLVHNNNTSPANDTNVRGDFSSPIKFPYLGSCQLQKVGNRKINCREDIVKELLPQVNETPTRGEDPVLNDQNCASLTSTSDGNVPPFGQGNESCAFELLKNLLTSENYVFSPLPGFNQIFHNSHTNSN